MTPRCPVDQVCEILHGLDLLHVLILQLHLELILELHHRLKGVQGVRLALKLAQQRRCCDLAIVGRTLLSHDLHNPLQRLRAALGPAVGALRPRLASRRARIRAITSWSAARKASLWLSRREAAAACRNPDPRSLSWGRAGARRLP
eukprot:CAMPEP_0113825844 /NCGR_PEP_ID=MMETSP0328-20130328/3956_1 /TAXON_ID=39455 /ORGANISM="Alexandrium minutum" /LENGTH=145 /DNA_ID=CAMNT_0000793805 /DNA_START=189 /DNA_END=623 /DNA_ORIENTATION=- /assembly_acc=CAM_ASM_000350